MNQESKRPGSRARVSIEILRSTLVDRRPVYPGDKITVEPAIASLLVSIGKARFVDRDEYERSVRESSEIR